MLNPFKDLPERTFEAFNRIRALEKDFVEHEANLLTHAEFTGFDLGANPKTRINYFVSLGILRQPKPIFFGKGRGGTRLVQKDAFEIFEFVHDQSVDGFNFNEIAGIIRERREDLLKKACREADIDVDILEKVKFWEEILKDLNSSRWFNYNLILAQVLSLKMSVVIKDLLHRVRLEIDVLMSFGPEIGPEKAADMIKARRKREADLLEILKKDTSRAEKVLENISQVE